MISARTIKLSTGDSSAIINHNDSYPELTNATCQAQCLCTVCHTSLYLYDKTYETWQNVGKDLNYFKKQLYSMHFKTVLDIVLLEMLTLWFCINMEKDFITD